MIFVIPMAGLSNRFREEGFTLPKYMLYVKNRSLFDLSVSSFEAYFATARFVFIALDLFDTKRFITDECKKLGIANYSIIILNRPTRGQAETVYLGLQKLDGQAKAGNLIIFNIDTIRHNYGFPGIAKETGGVLEVFKGSGKNWSYAKTNGLTDDVIETAEKKEISEYCSTGMYYFKDVHIFEKLFLQYSQHFEGNAGELYIAPMYNLLIQCDLGCKIDLIKNNDVVFSGVPAEYYQLLK